MAASLTLLQITSVDLMYLKARLFLERAGALEFWRRDYVWSVPCSDKEPVSSARQDLAI